jgi:Peptidase family M28
MTKFFKNIKANNMKNYISVLSICFSSIACAQPLIPIPEINVSEVTRIEKVLSSDQMEGRKLFSPGIDRAADFIASEFKNAGLETLNGASSYLQSFTMLRPRFVSAKGTIDGAEILEKNIIAFSTRTVVTSDQSSGYQVARINATDTFNIKARPFLGSSKNTIVFVDPAHEVPFNSLKRFKRETFPKDNSVIFVLTEKSPTNFSIEARHEFTELKLANVVGILPGKSKKDEFVIFSGHYDHLGIGKPNNEGDSIYNGANDDAAGTTAVIMLAKYFAKQKNNERTIVFATFTAEESGGFGSQYFSKQFQPEKVAAMFNIEMIGTDSKWGTNSAYITGYERTDMGQILQKNLEGSQFKFYPDPYPTQQLFYRSDNATLARLGVPAHTISTSKMDSEKFYHTQEDEIETLNLENMTEIIKAIALSSTSIIAGKDTPTRVDTRQLR